MVILPPGQSFTQVSDPLFILPITWSEKGSNKKLHLLGLRMLSAISAKNLDLIPTEEEVESTSGETGRLLFSIPRIGLGLIF